MSKHTPGPWKVYRAPDGLLGKLFATFRVKREKIGDNQTPVICLMDAERAEIEECEANAHLVAAAPDMLEALEMVRREWNAPEEYDRIINAAIAKATPK